MKPELGTLDASTIRNTLVPLRSILRHAHKRGRIAVNPTAGLELPAVEGRRDRVHHQRRQQNCLMRWQVGRAHATMSPLGDRHLRWSPPRRAAGSGLGRSGSWSGRVHVHRGWDAVDGAIEPKSRAGSRTVPVGSDLRGHLLQHHLKAGRPKHGHVFARADGRPFSPSSVRLRALTAWKHTNEQRAKDGLKPLAPIALHECRHSLRH